MRPLAALAVLAVLAASALLGGAAACSRDGGGRAPAGGSGALTAVTLMPSGTEVMAALGATELLIGVDAYSDYPPEVRRLPKVGSFLSPDLEAIVRLRPSLVIVDDVHGPAAAALRDAGLETVACAVHALPDVKRALRTVGARIGKAAEAERVVHEIDAALDAAAARRPARRPRVLAVIDREAGGLGSLVAAGPGSWVDELLAVVGGDNVLLASGVRYPKISLEEVLRGAPDVILDLSYAARGGLGPWRAVDVPATRTGRVIELHRPYLVAPSPRVTAALADLERAIVPP
ncbi:MAG TPA: helical backbone metal receptor [Kofleriaceae bacterium]|nr:helical backbone metal receptor [Kofleriaceae bacterium]